MRRSRILLPRLLAGLLALTLIAGSGCRTWRSTGAPGAVARTITDARGRPIRVRTSSIDYVELRGAHVEADSVVGRLSKADGASLGANPRIALALVDVRAVEEHRVSVRRTALAVAGGVLGALAVFVVLIVSSGPISLGQ